MLNLSVRRYGFIMVYLLFWFIYGTVLLLLWVCYVWLVVYSCLPCGFLFVVVYLILV